jgi:hypothetical protein
LPAFIGVPVLVDKAAIGVLCVLSSKPMNLEPEDLFLVRMFSDLCASILGAWANGQTVEAPAAGASVVDRASFTHMLEAELRLLDRRGGSMELAIVKLTDAQALGAALAGAPAPDRLLAGMLGADEAAVYKRSGDGDARQLLAQTLQLLRMRSDRDATGVVDLSVAGFGPLTARDMLRFAELSLAKTLEVGSPQRLVIEQRAF